jgi:GNAT superfamily N-acetyltransferase
MFVPFLANQQGWRQFESNMMAQAAIAYFLAFSGDEVVGVTSLGRPREETGHGPTGHAFVGETFVISEARRGGVGTELLRHAIDWARENAFELLALEYRAANLIGVPFWQSHGFRSFATILERRLDERIIWAKGNT